MKNTSYKASITASKGGKQLVNVITSTAFASFLVVVIKQLTDKDFEVTDIKSFIDNISGMVVFITPVVSTLIKMLSNFKNNYFSKK